MTVLSVVCVTDGRYAEHAGALIQSMTRTQAKGTIRMHVLHPQELPAEIAGRLRASAGAEFPSPELHAIPASMSEGWPRVGRFPSLVWWRLLLPELFPELDRILYLDADTVVTASLAPLAMTDLSNHWLAAVDNILEPRFRDRPSNLGLDSQQSYFNSGVLLMNLEKMRRDGCVQQLRDWTRRAPGLMWPDQDVLNAVLGPRRLRLHPRWNCQNSFFVEPWKTWAVETLGQQAHAEATAEPAILHFEGPSLAKPWHYLSVHPWRRYYFDCISATPWNKPRIIGRTPRNFLRRCAIRLRQLWRILVGDDT